MILLLNFYTRSSICPAAVDYQGCRAVVKLTQLRLLSSEISDLCENSDLLLFVSYFASQREEIKFGDCFFNVCCENQNILVRCQVLTTRYSTGIILTSENVWT